MDILLLIVGLILLILGSDYSIKASCTIADKLDISPLVVGLTVIAFGTSAPELFVSTGAALKGNADFSIGNIVGSNIFNVLGIISIAAIFSRIKFSRQILFRDIPVMFAALGSFWFFAADGNISRTEGIILFVCILIYILYLYSSTKNPAAITEKEEMEVKPWSLPLCVAILILSLIAMIFSSNLIVDHGSLIAKAMGVSDFIISATLVGIGTSLPELATTYAAARQNQSDLAIGNAIGSNIFNVFSVIGITSVIHPLTVDSQALSFDFPFMFLVPLLIWPIMIWRKSFFRLEGGLMLLSYCAYIYFLIQ